MREQYLFRSIELVGDVEGGSHDVWYSSGFRSWHTALPNYRGVTAWGWQRDVGDGAVRLNLS